MSTAPPTPPAPKGAGAKPDGIASIAIDESFVGARRYFPLALAAGFLLTILLYWLGPLLGPSQRMTGWTKSVREADAAVVVARSRLGENPKDKALEAEVLRCDEAARRARESPEAPGFWGSYWLKLVQRDVSGGDLAGVWLLHSILGVLGASLIYLCGLWWRPAFPGCGRMLPRHRQFLDERLACLRRRWDETRDADLVRGESESISALAESRVAFLLKPLKWAEWIMPVMGFLGTVVGISAAIVSLQLGIRRVFAEATVTPGALDLFNQGFSGLGFAFDTTFFGLFGLAIVGTLDLMMRRRALGALGAIDTASLRAIEEWSKPKKSPGDKEIEPDKVRLMKVADAVGRWLEEWAKMKSQAVPWLEWATKTLRPGLERELKENPPLRAWVMREIPRILGARAEELSQSVRGAMRDAERHLAGRVNTYGEILARLGAVQATDVRRARALFEFALMAARAAAASEGGFQEALASVLSEPLACREEMSVILPPSSASTVDAVAVTRAPHRVAAALRDRDTGESTIQIRALDAQVGETIVLHPVAVNKVASEIAGIALDHDGGRVAYALKDRTVGVFDLASGKEVTASLPGAVHARGGISWWRAGVHGLALVIEVPGGSSAFVFLPYLGTAGDDVGAAMPEIKAHPLQAIPLEGFRAQAVCVSEVNRRVVIGGVSEGRAKVTLVDASSGAFVPGDTYGIGEPGAAIASITLDPEGRHAYCGLESGRVVELDLETGNSERKATIDACKAILLAACDAHRRSLAVCSESGLHVRLLDATSWELQRRITAHGTLECATISADRALLVTGGSDGHVAVWEFPYYIGG